MSKRPERSARSTRRPQDRRTRASRAAESSYIRRLAVDAGILLEYVDQTGTQVRRASTETCTALLAAMGIDAPTEAAAARELAARRAAAAERLLAPVRVVPLGTGEIALRATPPARFGETVDWSVELREEGGRVQRSEGRTRRARDRSVAVRLLQQPPLGYHTIRLTVRGAGDEATADQHLIVTPARCFPAAEKLTGERVWGLTVNLYSVHSERNWGIGDLSDLRTLVDWAGDLGAAFVGVNPLHALRNAGYDISPYSPVSRLFRSVGYIDVEAVPELETCVALRQQIASQAFRQHLEELRGKGNVDYAAVMALKGPAFETLHREFAARHRGRGGRRGRDYESYVRDQGELLTDYATFCALEDVLSGRVPGSPFPPEPDAAWSWQSWPPEFRDPDSPAVTAFRASHAERVDLHRWLQFELDRQLSVAAEAARSLALPVGVYPDLAIGAAPSGSDAWAFPTLLARGVSLGAPPDPLGPRGQDWGLPPIDPVRLAADGYRYWSALLRASFRHAGALRIDHILGLFRQYWIPHGMKGSQGAYVRWPTEDVLGVLALESVRAQAVVVGEDLGTVPEEVPGVLERWGILSSKVFYFERERTGAYRPARSYTRNALATANTHDLATLRAFWEGRDIDIREALHVLPNAKRAEAARRSRVTERRQVVERLLDEGLLSEALLADGIDALGDEEIRAAVHAFLRRTPSWLVGLSLDDIAGEREPVNVPGVQPSAFPGWSRRMSLSLEALRALPRLERVLGVERARARALHAATPPAQSSGTGRTRLRTPS